MAIGIAGKVKELAYAEAESIFSGLSFPRAAQVSSSAVNSGKITSFTKDNTVKVKLDNGELREVELTGDFYPAVGKRVDVIGTQII